MANEVELEEIRQLQAIVARHEDHAFKIRGVMYALLTALAVALFGQKRMFDGSQFLQLCVVVILLFLLVELVHRALARLAILRSSDVEDMLRSGGARPYDGPRIGLSLGQPPLLKLMFGEALTLSVAIHYLGLVLAVAAIAYVGW